MKDHLAFVKEKESFAKNYYKKPARGSFPNV